MESASEEIFQSNVKPFSMADDGADMISDAPQAIPHVKANTV
jgi:hypothetical protein